jgi:hypothetical protein
LVEHGLDARHEGLGPIEHTQQWSGRVEPSFAHCGEEILYDGGVLGVSLSQAERVLGAVDADPEGDDAEVIGEVHAVDHEGHEVELAQVGREHVRERRLGGSDEAA